MATPVQGAEGVPLLLVRELHRRQTRYDSGPAMSEYARTQVEGELIGLRVALGVSLGYEAATPEVVPAARRFYAQWLTSDAEATGGGE